MKEKIELMLCLALLGVAGVVNTRCSVPESALPTQADRAQLCAAAVATGHAEAVKLCEANARFDAIAEAFLCRRD